MVRKGLAVLAALALMSAPALAAEGGAMLSPADLQAMQPAYEAFLDQLEDTLVGHGLLDEENRALWHAAQIGDYLTNGGYGSLLITYQPDALGYVREETMAVTLSCMLGTNVLELGSLRRYTPDDSDADGLLLSFSLENESGLPVPASFALDSNAGVFARWDPLSGGYAAVGTGIVTDGETVLWAAPAPAEGARDPVITLQAYDLDDGAALGTAELTLRVEGGGYVLDDDALNGRAGE